MAATPSGKGIPWHRVIGERGKILIREPYASLQRKLLESEGVKVIQSRVDLKRHLWKPPNKSALKPGSSKKAIENRNRRPTVLTLQCGCPSRGRYLLCPRGALVCGSEA